jgi:hypothetical protein
LDEECCWMLLGLKPSHTCDVISVVAEFIASVAGAEAQPYAIQWHASRVTRSSHELCHHP